jgi:hypothetical protein
MAYVGFDKLKGQLAGKPGVTNPGALAASIGRKKYGGATFNKAAANHTSLRKAAAKKALER